MSPSRVTTPTAGSTAEPTAEESALIAAFLDGDYAATQKLERWASKAAQAFRRLLGNDWDDAQQEVQVELFKVLGAGNFAATGTLEAFVARVARYRCIDRLRRRGNPQWVDIDSVTPWLRDRTVLTRFEDQVTSRSFLNRLVSLPQDCRKLWTWIAEGYSYQEMSEEWGVSAGTLRVRVRRCRQKAFELRDEILHSEVTQDASVPTGSAETSALEGENA